jgi:hypothetical protein
LGDRIVLDRIDGLDACGASSLQLEAVATRRTQFSGAAGFRGGRGAGRGAGGGAPASPAPARGAATQTSRGGGTADPAAAAAAGRSTAMSGRAGGRGAGGGAPAAAGAPAFGRSGTLQAFFERGGPYTAQLWLVHRPPPPEGGTTGAAPAGAGRGGRASRGSVTMIPSGDRMALRLDGETTLTAVHRFQVSGTGFSFPALSIDTARGSVSVIVTGTMSVRLRDGAPQALIVTIRRQTTTPDSGTAAEGTTGPQEIAWDKAREVVSFELPAPNGGAAADPLAGHRLELRLRVTGQ